jgi:DNA mismatch repair protein MutS
VGRHSSRIKETAAAIAQLDVLASLAHVAHKYDYIRPQVDDSAEIHIVEGRHPVVEQGLPPNSFVPNDIHLDNEKEQVLVITGPNMSGKSTILRQVALIVLMAQMGSFVPATEVRIGVVDRIFTRVGAMDDIARGHSTFMVEMIETSNIVHQATAKSLVILDEIGRGTSTFDGISIAWAVAEFLHDRRNKGVKTLFATHYHELTKLAQIKERVANYNVAVKGWNDRVIFLRKLLRGGASHSYGIEVARMAGLPKGVIKRAQEIMSSLEKGKFSEVGEHDSNTGQRRKEKQIELFVNGDGELRKRLNSVDVDSTTPLEALHILHELKTLAGEQNKPS